MSRHDPVLRLRHMRDFAAEALKHTQGKSRPDLEKERLLQLSLARLVELIGEAASKIPAEFRASQPGVPWREIINMRHRLIHGYDLLDLDILWQTVAEDLPSLLERLDQVLSEI